MKGSVYLLTNENNAVIYTGVTSDLKNRVKQHKLKKYAKSFTARYNLDKLVYYEKYNSIGEAIYREKQIKGGSRKKKVELIERMNPGWIDLSEFVDG